MAPAITLLRVSNRWVRAAYTRLSAPGTREGSDDGDDDGNGGCGDCDCDCGAWCDCDDDGDSGRCGCDCGCDCGCNGDDCDGGGCAAVDDDIPLPKNTLPQLLPPLLLLVCNNALI